MAACYSSVLSVQTFAFLKENKLNLLNCPLLQVISDVPADSLFRTERPPTKEIMRYFIRHYALRLGMGESAPWVVEDELVKKFNLPSKFSDFLLDPHKVIHSKSFSACSFI